MASRTFTPDEWARIRRLLDENPQKYGLPVREYGSAVLASFNIRKLGSVANRSPETWDFLAHVSRHYDLLAVQEIMDDLSGFKELKRRLGPEFGVVVSDKTGAFPGEPGVGERLGFIFNWSIVQRGEVVSDISFDRSKLLETVARNKKKIEAAIAPHEAYFEALHEWVTGGEVGKKPKKPNVKLPVFVTFIRQPFCVSFRIVGHPGRRPYEFMAVNAHLYFGDFTEDRRQEFDAIMEWIMARVKEKDKAYYPNFILLGDLNLDFNHPATDRGRIENHLKTFNQEMEPLGAFVNFPFLDVHPGQADVFRTNARLTETFDQIGLFSRETRFPTYLDNETMGSQLRGPDFGVFNFVDLFSEALLQKPAAALLKSEKRTFYRRFEHEVSDHLPLWLRLPLP